MKNKLDDLTTLKKFDEKLVLSSIKLLPDQARQAWREVAELKLPESFKRAQNIVICGMGGSALGGRVVKSLTEKKIRAPIEIVNQYYLPDYVNNQTLVVLSSYSGNTEEVLSAAYEALKQRAKIFVLTTGGQLAKLMTKEKLKGYLYEPLYNPAKMPRLAIGYSIFSLLSLFNKTGYISLTDEVVNQSLYVMEEFVREYGPRTPTANNLAKTLAFQLNGKIPILVTSEHLRGVVHVFKNFLNETSKVFSASFDIPELNHHLMEGLRNPVKLKEVLYFLFISSESFGERVKKRYLLTQDVVKKNFIQSTVYQTRAAQKLDQVAEVLIFGVFVSFYLAVLANSDPSAIPWVDYFKEKLR